MTKWGTGVSRLPTRAVETYHRWYYRNAARTWKRTHWRGVPVQKAPSDLWTLGELIHQIHPRLIIEGGTADGGSALWLADCCQAANTGLVLTIDVRPPPVAPYHPRLQYLTGSTLDPDVLATVRTYCVDRGPVLVILDDDHRKDHVLAELRAYSPLVTPGSYLVVEDTNLGHLAWRNFGPGPAEALAQWFAEDAPPFDVDPQCERHGMTFHPGGWLRRRDG
jgi:cephalosporin hydroxylase